MEILDIITILLLVAIVMYVVDFGYKCTVEGFSFSKKNKTQQNEII
tara:strand:- start:525 stop:662 length:138 start_codon:yes stop_codon:yes gene_type:complete